MKISGKTKMCIIIGDPVEHSLSPLMHNAAYQALGIEDQFVFTAARVDVKKIQTVVEAVRIMGIRGLTCTIPHKVEVIKYLDRVDPIAKKIGAVNTVVNEQGKLIGYNTDWLGTVTPLKKITQLKNKKVAVIGAGGVSRAIIYGVSLEKAKVKIFNRDFNKAERLAKEFNCLSGELSQLSEVKNYDIIINATSLGMAPDENKSSVSIKYLRKNQIIFDAVYVPYETKLLKDAKKIGAKIIHGIDMLLYQGTAQFELYTNRKAPEKIMRQILYKHLKIKQ